MVIRIVGSGTIHRYRYVEWPKVVNFDVCISFGALMHAKIDDLRSSDTLVSLVVTFKAKYGKNRLIDHATLTGRQQHLDFRDEYCFTTSPAHIAGTEPCMKFVPVASV